MLRRSMAQWRGTVVRVACVVVGGLTLAACDKCGNSIFRSDAGPIACKDERPR